MAPIHLQFCIAFYCSTEPRSLLGNSYDSPVGKEVKAWMLAEGLILGGAEDWGTPTDRLEAFVNHLCEQQLPISETVTRWVQPGAVAKDKP